MVRKAPNLCATINLVTDIALGRQFFAHCILLVTLQYLKDNLGSMRFLLSILQKNRGFVALALLSSAFLLPACSQSQSPSRPGDILHRGLQGSPESLDPHKYSSVQTGRILGDIGESLVIYTPSGALTGGAAERWEVSENGLEYVFFLRPDAKWSNGEPVLASHFEYSFRRMLSPKTASPVAKNLAAIVNAEEVLQGKLPPDSLGVSAEEAHVFRVVLRDPTPYFLQLLTHASTVPILPSVHAQLGSEYFRPENFVGNGAYRLAEFRIGSEIGLIRNEHYWDNSETCFDRVVYHIVEPAQEVLRYRAGELDVTDSIEPTQYEAFLRERPDEVKVAPSLGVYYYGFNLTKPFLRDNLALRKALSMAIDREALVEVITKRGEQQAYSFVPPGVSSFDSESLPYEAMPNVERVREARRLFASAGYGPDNPLNLEIRYNTLGGHKLVAIAIQSMWREHLGVEAHLVSEEYKVFLSNVRSMENTEVYRLSWTGDYNDAQTFLQLFQTGHSMNLTGYSNQKVDELLDSAAQIQDLNARKEMLQEAERLVLADHPVIPLYFYVSKHLVHPSIRGWQSNLMDVQYSKDLCRAQE
jgi:ABC-type oligopeptide transport system substrate-binding subunit